MRKLRRIVPFGLAVMMSLQGIYPAVPVMANTTNIVSTKKSASSATVLSKKERAKIMQQINAMSPEEGLKLAKKKGLIKDDADTKEDNLKKATVNKDAKEGEVGYQFTQDQYVDETHRIRYEYTVTAEGEVSAQYVKGIVYEDGNPKKEDNKEVTYDITDELTYPAQVTLNNTTYKVTDAATLNVKAKHLIIPEGVETCWDSSTDKYVEKMTIPSTLKKFDRSFYGHSSYDNDKSELEWKKSYVFKGYELSNPDKTKYVSVKDGIVYNKDQTEMVSAAPCALEKDVLTLPDTLKEIPAGSFKACKGIKKLVFGKNITSIGNGAFAYSNIEDVQMNDNVTSLDEYAFYYCTKLTNVDLSEGLTKIDGYETFKYTTALKHIDLKNVTKLTGWYTFVRSGLEDVDLSNVESVDGVQVFGSCYDLKTVYIGKNTDFSSRTGIGCNCFVSCDRLEKYVQKEDNIHNLYVEDGKLYSSKIEGYVSIPDGDIEEKVLSGKILLGYPVQMQKKDAEKNNGTLKIDNDITAIGYAGLTTYGQYVESDGTVTTDKYCNKVIVPASVGSMELVYMLPQQDVEIDFYGNTLPALSRHSLYSVNDKNAAKDDAVLGTKTIKFKTAALKDEFEQHWKEHVMYIYEGENDIYDVLPEKKTTSLILNKTSDKILCDGTSHEIHLIAKLSEDDCTDVVTFKSSNENVATVDGNGVVTTKAYHPGKTTITATAGDHTATYELTQVGSGIDVTADQKAIVHEEWSDADHLLDDIKKSLHVTCADCQTELKEGTDYEVVVSDYRKTGKVDVTIKGIGAFEGMTAKTSVNVEYHKHGEQGYRIDGLTTSGYDWTGKEVKPDVKVSCKDCNKELKEGTDYKLEYQNNVNVGTATLKVVGIGAYEGVDQTYDYKINEACGWNGFYATDTAGKKVADGGDLGAHEYNDETNQYLPGNVALKCNHCDRTLTKGKDYMISYSDTTKPGKATVKITGIGSYDGCSATYTYTIKPREFQCDGVLECSWKGNGKESNVDLTGKIIYWNNHTSEKEVLVEGKDFKAEYSDNKKVGTGTVKIIGLGLYAGYEKTFSYTISMPHGWNGFYTTYYKDGDDIGTYGWDENGVKPYVGAVFCKDDGTFLTEGVDYTITYSNTTKPGKATITIRNTGDYQGNPMTLYYTIEPRSFYMDGVNEGGMIDSYSWTGKEIKPVIKGLKNESGETLVEGKDYRVEYPENMIDDGEKTIRIIGLGDYEGRKQTYCYYIVKSHGWNGFHARNYEDGADLGSFEWTGNTIQPDVGTLLCSHCEFETSDSWLQEGIDYTVELSNPYGPGKASMKIIGLNRYAGHELNFTYTIKNKTFSFEGHEDGDNLGTVEYTGNEVKYPISNVTDKTGKTLTEGSDYKLVYSDNVNIGTATVKIIGLGDYEGCTLSFTYKILNMDGESGFSSNTYTDGSSLGSFDYTGEEVKPSVGMIYSHYNHAFLIEGTDYKIEYSDNVNPGIAKAKVVGIGRFAGHELNFTFRIRSKKFSSKKYENETSLGTVKWTGKAVIVDPGEMIDETDGHVLTEGTDYRITYSNNINVGKATVRITGLGYYEGESLTFYYSIKKQCGWNGFYAKDHEDGDSLGVFNWTGNSILIDPDMRCKHCGKELQENVDYKVEYENNMDPGVAKMKVIGIGDFEGYELNFTFRIRKKNPATTEDKDTTTTTETKPTTGTTEDNSTAGTTESTTTTTTEETTTTTETKPTESSTTTETRPSTSTTETTTTEQPTTTATKQKKKLTSVTGIKNATYSGKTIKCKITVKSEKSTLKENKQYKVTYKNNKNCGIATVKITGIGDYQGTITKTFKIVPKKAVIHAVKAAKKAETVEIRKNDGGVTGYQISYSYKKNFKGQKYKELKKCKYKNVKIKRKKYTITSYKIKSLKSKKYVYVRVRAYKQVGKTKIYGSWSSTKKVKIK